MKKIVLFSLIATLFASATLADMYKETTSDCSDTQMRAALDRATYEHRAVITTVECENGIVRIKPKQNKVGAKKSYKSCDCGCDKKEEVVKREYFVRETVQQYEPVVQYVPTTTYTRVKPACNHGC